jgi:transposase-like protein
METSGKKERKARRVISAREKAQAVLAVWSGRRTTSRICKELGASWGLLKSWEKKALAGMLKGLGGEALPARTPGELGSRLENLLGETQPTGTNPAPLPPEQPAGTVVA